MFLFLSITGFILLMYCGIRLNEERIKMESFMNSERDVNEKTSNEFR